MEGGSSHPDLQASIILGARLNLQDQPGRVARLGLAHRHRYILGNRADFSRQLFTGLRPTRKL